jgi:hypothetical protein
MHHKGPEEFCSNVWEACSQYDSRNVGYFALVFCLGAGITIGMKLVRAIRGWIRAKPGNVVFYAFYLFAFPITLSIGVQAAAVSGILSPYCSMALSLGLVIGISKAMHIKTNGKDISTKETGPMIKVIGWSHFRRTIVWIDNFNVTIEELINKFAVGLGVSPDDIQLENGAGSFVDMADYGYPLWKLRKNEAIGVTTSFFGFSELSLFITVFDEFSHPELITQRAEANRIAKEAKMKIAEAAKKAAAKSVKNGGVSPKKKRVFTTKWIKKRLGGKKSSDPSNALSEVDNDDDNDDDDDDDDEDDEDEEMLDVSVLAEEKRKRLDALESVSSGDLSEREKRKLEYLKKFDVRKKVVDMDFLPKESMVDAFVNMIMEDESMNIYGFPDKLENSMYKMVLSKSLGIMYRIMHKSVTTVEIFGHHLELDIEECLRSIPIRKAPIDVEAVEALVDILLDYKAVNMSLLADGIEKQLYTNVIVVGFGVMSTFLDTFMVDFCGHRLEAKFQPNGMGFINKEERMEDFRGFLDSSVDDGVLGSFVDDMMAESGAEGNWVPDYFEKAVFRSIFTLVLYVFKEISGEVVINLLGDNFRMRLVPGKPEKSERQLLALEEETRKEFMDETSAGVDEHKVILAVAGGLMAGSLFF